jgi:hypothetical protein
VPDMRPGASQLTIRGVRGEVLAYVAEHLNYLDEAAARTATPGPSARRLPRERAERLRMLVRIVGQSEVPSPHYLRSLAAQACAWLEELRERGEVSW